MPLQEIKFEVWCAVSATTILGPILYSDTINSGMYIRKIVTGFIESLSDVGRDVVF